MRRHCSVLFVIAGMLLGSAFWLHGPLSQAEEQIKPGAKAADKDKPAVKEKVPVTKTILRAFMRKKLAAAQNVLEGLAVEDFDQIAEGAKQLKATAGAAEFMVSQDPEYIEHAEDFRRIVNKLAVAAKEKRLDGATLAYLDMTMSCVECHKHVRGLRLAEGE
jgi:hypothetical protein